jgi:hypothetical protein
MAKSRLLPADLEDQVVKVANYRAEHGYQHDTGFVGMPFNQQRNYFRLRNQSRKEIKERIKASPLFKIDRDGKPRFGIPRKGGTMPLSQPGKDILEGMSERLLDHFIDACGLKKERKGPKPKTIKGYNELAAQMIVDVLQNIAVGISKDRGIMAAAYIFHAFGLEDGEVEKIYNRLRLRLSPKRTKLKMEKRETKEES